MDIDTTKLGQFDVILAVHLLCYSRNIDELRNMLHNVSLCMKKGGRFIGVRECMTKGADGKLLQLPSVKGDLEDGPMFAYKLIPNSTVSHNEAQTQFNDFCQCKLSLRNSHESPFTFTNFPVYESTMIRMFAEAGFKINLTGWLLSCSTEGQKLFPNDFIKTLTADWGSLMWYFDVTLPE